MAACVLIVDDEPAVRALATDILAEAGFDTIAAADADQALHVLTYDEKNVDVLFTDVRMPGAMSGLDLARTVKRNWPDLRVIITSGYFAGDFPGANFLRKPWSAAELISRVEQAVA
ncbi:MAG: response regulator [Methylobacteriaceae bacterium]|nr:response regulator [Methylobacteriaceae bacterium]